MPFFQNPFPDEFDANLLLSDRHFVPEFVLKGNAGRGKEIAYAWTQGPYVLNNNDADGASRRFLNIVFCLYNFKNWGTIQVDLTSQAANAAAVLPEEVVVSLNANSLFSERFVADLGTWTDSSVRQIRIRQKRPVTEFKFYIGNTQAEEALRFNARAGVAELPTYFAKHTIANRFTYAEGEGRIIQLNPSTSNVDASIINKAVDAKGVSLGFSSGTVQQDWQLLRGKSGYFNFQKGPSGSAVSTTQTVINYPAGAKAGDLAEKVVTQLDGTGAVVAQFHLPYTLASGDLITPP